MAGPHGLKLPPIDEFTDSDALAVACTLLLCASPVLVIVAASALRWCVEAVGYCLIMGVAAGALRFMDAIS